MATTKKLKAAGEGWQNYLPKISSN